MTKECLGGYRGKLYVDKTNGGRYYFWNNLYGMEMYVNPDDINYVIQNPQATRWGSGSYSNDVDQEDKRIIVSYLKRKICRYKTVTDVIKSRSKYKERYLMQFPMEELQEYIKNKEDKNVKVKSGG